MQRKGDKKYDARKDVTLSSSEAPHSATRAVQRQEGRITLTSMFLVVSALFDGIISDRLSCHALLCLCTSSRKVVFRLSFPLHLRTLFFSLLSSASALLYGVSANLLFTLALSAAYLLVRASTCLVSMGRREKASVHAAGSRVKPIAFALPLSGGRLVRVRFPRRFECGRRRSEGVKKGGKERAGKKKRRKERRQPASQEKKKEKSEVR